MILVAVGGSATTDGGAGALQAIEEAGGLSGAKIVVLSDVQVPWERCAEVFGPQKGADPEHGEATRQRLDELADTFPRDPRGVPMTGAAGGLSGGLWAVHGAELEPGAPFILNALDFDERMRAARAVITGEGKLDEQTLQGKLVGEIGTRTRQAGVPLHAIVGTDALDQFGKRMIDLQVVTEATTLEEVERAARGARRAAGDGGRVMFERFTEPAPTACSRTPPRRRAAWATGTSAPSTCCSASSPTPRARRAARSGSSA